MSSPVKVVSVGRLAQAVLGKGDARVLAVFERSAYVETAAGLACIGVLGNGPLNAVCEFLPTGLRAGDSVRTDLSGATSWRPRPAPAFEPSLVLESLDQLSKSARSTLPSEGLGYLLDGSRDRPDAVKSLDQWIAKPDGTPDAAAGLIGLGPGLTPSGDDLVGGVLCALHAAGFKEAATRLAGWALPIATTATSRISYAHLACAAEGECGETLNDAMVALLSGQPPDLQRIDSIGHTSGWDALAGVALALGALGHSQIRQNAPL